MSNTLIEGLKRAAKDKPEAPKDNGKARDGRVLIGGHFDPSVRQRLMMIRAKHPERTTQDLLAEALNLLFDAHRLPKIDDQLAAPSWSVSGTEWTTEKKTAKRK